jgi:hypothetical protein
MDLVKEKIIFAFSMRYMQYWQRLKFVYSIFVILCVGKVDAHIFVWWEKHG